MIPQAELEAIKRRADRASKRFFSGALVTIEDGHKTVEGFSPVPVEDVYLLLEEVRTYQEAVEELDILLRDFLAGGSDEEIPELLECGEQAALLIESLLVPTKKES